MKYCACSITYNIVTDHMLIFRIVLVCFVMCSVRNFIQSIIDEAKAREKYLMQSIICEERSRLAQLESLQQLVTMAASFASAVIFQSQRLSHPLDDLTLLTQMKEFHQVETRMIEATERAQQKFTGARADSKRPEIVEKTEGDVHLMKSKIDTIGMVVSFDMKYLLLLLLILTAVVVVVVCCCY